MKLKFFMFCHKKSSVRDKVIGKKWIYLERYTFHRMWSVSKGKNSLERNTVHRQSVGHLRRQETPKYGVVSFYQLDNFTG